MTDQDLSATPVPSGGPRASRISGLLGIGLILIAFALFKWPVIQGRFAVAAIGIFVIALVVLRPPGFWDAPSVRNWRRVFGDWAVVVIYVAIGIAGIVAAFIIPMQ
jgi:hypothetical protein